MADSGVALAIWVKTPGLSPVKTRLAAALGEAQAVSIFETCVAATAAVAQKARQNETSLRPLWAVAETDAMSLPRWQGLPRVAQGEGTLGERLAQVYGSLIESHDAVLFIGADAPQVEASVLADARRRLTSASCDFLLGRAADGGFWLFGGRRQLPESVWTQVAYSTADTADALASGLIQHGSIDWLKTLHDLDRIEDVPHVAAALRALKAPLPDQTHLLARLQALLPGE